MAHSLYQLDVRLRHITPSETGYPARMFKNWMRLAVFTVAACGSPKSAPTTTPPPPTGDGVLGPDGHHVAKERVYEGDCMPAGTRGGCHRVTLLPDGTFINFLFDAAMNGTYSIDGATVSLQGPDPEPITMTLSADGKRLDTLDLKP